MQKIKMISWQIIRTGLRLIPGVGELVEGVFQCQDAIAYHEMQKLVEDLQRKHGELLSKWEVLGEHQTQQVIAQYAPSLVKAHSEQFAEVGHKLGVLPASDPKVIDFERHFDDSETSEFLDESGLEKQFPHLSKDILKHISREGRISDIYEIGKEIGRGGMSRIVAARRKGDDNSKWIALKILRPEVGKIERFLIEGYVGKYHLESPCLLDISDFGGFLNSGEYFIECELLEGQSLEQWLQQCPYRGPSDGHIAVMEWMAYGLQYLHNQGFVHRDVKPANFFLTNNGEIKLLDFGIIKSLRQGISSNLTRATQILGTPSYKAPEQINQLLGSITFKTDVYGLGVALFELFTRQLPFKGGSAFEIERQHLQEEIPNPQLFNALIPDAVSNLIQWCLQKTPAERPEIENVIQTIRSVSIGYSASAEQHTLDEITALSRVGLREEAQVTAEEQKIVEQEIEKAGETRSLVDWQMLGKRRGKVLAELKKRREQNSTVLEQYAQQLSEWTLGQYPQLCPNLLCLAERREGSRVCGNCQCDFSGMLCAACGRQTSFFSQRCQMCGTSVDLQVKIGFAAECVAIAKKADELECAKAYLAMQWLLKNYKLDAKWQEKAKEWHKAFANANSRWLQDKLEAFRQGCREIVANARKSQIEQLKSQKEQLIPRAQLLLNGGQPLDALEELHKIPCEIRDKQTEQLLNQIHEVLTANELQEAESMLKSKSPEKVLSLLKGLRYKSERQTRLLQEAAQAIETRNKEQIRQRQQQEQEQIRQIQQEQIRQIQQKRRNLLKIVGSIVAVVLAVLIWWMVKCPSGQERCGGQCVDLASNAGHCGGCGKVCSGGAICKAGECVCASGQERCGGQCVDLASNAGHCGGCGKVCSGGAMCKAGKCVRDENYAYIPAGSFIMGSPDNEPGRSNNESPRRKVTISRPFRIMRTEMTQGQFQSLMGYNPSHFNNCGANCPVENVNWHEACASANALSRKHGLTECYACRGSGRDVICEVKSEFSDNYQSCPGWRLPTEAEWEYAARAGSSTAFYNGAITKTECELDPNLNKIGWYCGNSGRKTHPVGGKQANAWGLYDMSGNVYEWVHDWYQDSYRNLPTVDPVGPNTGSDRVFRGGSYDYFALSCRAAIRYRYTPTYRYGNLGLRFLRSL